MEETLKMMKSAILGNEGGKGLDILIQEYKDLKSPNILAYIFIKNYGLIHKTSKLYNLDSDECASFALQELDKCLLSYNSDISKFMTYFCKCYKNRLRTEYESLTTKKRKVMFYCNSLDAEEFDIEDTIDRTLIDYNDFKNNYNLTDKELEQCKLLDYGYKPQEICNKIGYSISFFYKANAIIKRKILNDV